MRLAVGEPLPPSVAAPTQPGVRGATDMVHDRVPSFREYAIGADDETSSLALRVSVHGDIGCSARAGGTGARCGFRPGYFGQPSRSGLFRGAIFEHRLGDRSRRQQAGWCHQARRSPAWQFQSALQGPGAGSRHGLLARSQNHRGGLDRQQLGNLHRHRHQCGEAHDLCRPFAARGVLYAGRQGSLGDRSRRGLCRGARRQSFDEKSRIKRAGRTGHADLLARREIRLCLLIVQSGNRRRQRRRPSDRRSRQAGQPVLPEYRRDAGRQAGLVHAEGYRQHHGVQRAAAVQCAEDVRYRSDHQPCQLRPQCQWDIRLCHGRRAERGQGIPYRRFLAGCDDSGRQAAARGLAVGRRQPGLRRARKRRCA